MLFRGTRNPSGWIAGASRTILLLGGICALHAAADFDEALRLYRTGNYTGCVQIAEKIIAQKVRDEEWPIVLIRAQLALGRYPDAEATLTNALNRYYASIRLRVLGCDVVSAAGKPAQVQALLGQIIDLGRARMPNYRDPPNLVALGKAALLLGNDPKSVLENFFDRARKSDTNYLDAYVASGQLALDEHDYDLAAKIFDDALKRFPEEPDVLFGLAQAYEPSQSRLMLKWIEATLDRNTNHVPSMLLLADHQVDAENYAVADEILDRALSVNPAHPDAWAYKAILSHLRNDTDGETAARTKALQVWNTNPRVDYLIGKKLSQNYRFTEGSSHQRTALSFNEAYLPSRIQLAQDLLRLGREEEGWSLAESVHQADGYDVTALNLTTLKETLQKFRSLTNENFIVRMAPKEADLYGAEVLDLLNRANKLLAEKYGLKPDRPTLIEIFPEQKDFGVRTFGMPHNPGFLGVCFGHVVTANSPASQAGNAANWQAVLWHEYCHVITLQRTRNKMPRWLSEGISVYEERQANPTWGQSMTPQFREMILGDDLTPVGRLSSAFLSPKTPMHMQFAYFQSSLVVEFLVNRFGFESLKQILQDLGEGISINQAIANRTAPIDTIEKEFAAFARDRANKLAPGLDWVKPDLAVAPVDSEGSRRRSRPQQNPLSPGDVASFPWKLDPNSTNYWQLLQTCQSLVREKKWTEAKAPLQRLIDLFPEHIGAQNAYEMLAAVYRALNETEHEREVLAKLAALDDAAPDAYLRLIELGTAAKDWPEVELNAERFLAVNPLISPPHRTLALASAELGKNDTAIRSYQRVLLLDPPDPAEVHYRLAQILHKTGAPTAKRQVLQALEEAPRFAAAQQLLLQITTPSPTPDKNPTPTPDGVPNNP